MIFTGGPFVWILLALALVAVVVYFERMLDLRRAQVDWQDFLKGVVNVLDSGSDDEALAICEDINAPVGRIVSTAIHQRKAPARVLREAVDAQGRAEIGRLDRRLAVLAIIAQCAPAVGFLGVIVGFIRVVLAVNGQAVVSRADLMGGAMAALVPAALGLAVAIPTSVMYGSLRVRLDRAVVELEAAASQILGYISTRREQEKELEKEKAK